MHLTNSHVRRQKGMGRALVALALLVSFCTTLLAGVVALAAPAGAVTCDTWTNTSGGAWDTGTNWSALAPPTGTTPACITAAGSYTVTIANETISAGALTVGGTGSTPTLTIGNSSSGFANVTFASVSNAGTIEPGLGATLTVPGAFTNTGTVDVPSSTFGGATLDLSALTNQGAFDVNQTSSLSLPTSSATLTNSSTGTLSVASGQTLTVNSPSGQTGTVTQDGVIDNSGSLIVADTLSVAGGSICNNTPQVGISGGSAAANLAFAATVGSGPSCGTGIATDNVHIANVTGTLSGNIPSSYTVSIGDGGSSKPNITIPSAMTILGTLDVGFEGSLTSTAPITNEGTLDAVSSGFAGEAFSLASLTNEGAFDINTPSTYSLPTNASTLTNASTGTVNVSATNSLAVTSPSGLEGTVSQDGVINNSGSIVVQDAVSVKGGSICGTAVHVGGDAQSAAIGSSLAFASTVTAGPSCGTGVATDNLFIANVAATLSGSIPKTYTVAIGDSGAGFANVTIPSAMTIKGTLDVGFEGSLSSNAAITNTGTLDSVASSFNSETVTFASFTNEGKLELNTNATYSLPKKTSTLVNEASGTIETGAGIAVTVSSPSGVVGALVTQDGVIDNTGSLAVQDAMTVGGGSICGNSVHLGVDGQSTAIPTGLTFASKVAAGPSCGTGVETDNLFIANVTGTLAGTIPKAYTVAIGDSGSSFAHVTVTSKKNAGTFEPGFGATVLLPKFQNKGTFEVPASAFSTVLTLGGTLTNKKTMNLDANTAITGNVINNRVLSLAAGSTYSVTGTFTQGTAGTFEPALASASSFGVLTVSSTAALAGKVAPQVASGYTPTSGTTYVVLKSGGLGGTSFATVVGSFTQQVISGDNIQLKAN
jgi:hypothetical protein